MAEKIQQAELGEILALRKQAVQVEIDAKQEVSRLLGIAAAKQADVEARLANHAECEGGMFFAILNLRGELVIGER